MGVFPMMGKIDGATFGTIKDRAGQNFDVSKLSAWLRIASAVVSENKKHTGLILETIPHNQDFASTYGTSTRSGAVGVDFGDKPIFADNDRGFRPSPVIESATIENGNRGLSRKAKFSIKCFTLQQAELLTNYFYQPGYVVLVEFGWNLQESMEQRAT